MSTQSYLWLFASAVQRPVSRSVCRKFIDASFWSGSTHTDALHFWQAVWLSSLLFGSAGGDNLNLLESSSEIADIEDDVPTVLLDRKFSLILRWQFGPCIVRALGSTVASRTQVKTVWLQVDFLFFFTFVCVADLVLEIFLDLWRHNVTQWSAALFPDVVKALEPGEQGSLHTIT